MSFDLDQLLTTMVNTGGSDLHIKAGEPPVIRVDGKLRRLDMPRMTAEDTRQLAYGLLDGDRREKFERNWELDLSYELEGLSRFRVNVFRQQGAVGMVLRAIPINIQSIEELGLPPVLKEVAMRPRGFVLVTGPTGSGKSTTLAAMIHYLNQNKRCHVITIEDPIEFIHTDNMAVVNQREVGMDTHGFSNALKHVMRQNPDVILVGEMRDLETISLAITAAETGHLVFATLHTTDAAQTVDRIIDVFPPQQQQQVRMQLAVTLEAVICQTLLPRVEGKGRVPAFEVMLATPAIRANIREGKTHQIPTLVQTGGDRGMFSLDQNLLQLLKEGKIRYEDALAKSQAPREFEQRARRNGTLRA